MIQLQVWLLAVNRSDYVNPCMCLTADGYIFMVSWEILEEGAIWTRLGCTWMMGLAEFLPFLQKLTYRHSPAVYRCSYWILPTRDVVAFWALLSILLRWVLLDSSTPIMWMWAWLRKAVILFIMILTTKQFKTKNNHTADTMISMNWLQWTARFFQQRCWDV